LKMEDIKSVGPARPVFDGAIQLRSFPFHSGGGVIILSAYFHFHFHLHFRYFTDFVRYNHQSEMSP
jgi:hypothetical protein